jgi:hypothetical protein
MYLPIIFTTTSVMAFKTPIIVPAQMPKNLTLPQFAGLQSESNNP